MDDPEQIFKSILGFVFYLIIIVWFVLAFNHMSQYEYDWPAIYESFLGYVK